MIWLILLFTITTCDDVNLVKDTDPFSKITTIKGATPIIEIEPYENNNHNSVSPSNRPPIDINYIHPDFDLHLYRINDDISIVIEQTMLHERAPRGKNTFKPILGSDSYLQLVFDNGEVVSIKYVGRRIEARDAYLGASQPSNIFERRRVSINGHFRLNQNHVTLLKNNRVKLLRVKFENSTTDREFNSDNENYFIKYLNCLEL